MGVTDLLSLRDRVALVTEASRRLGRPFASALAVAGAHIAVYSRHASDLDETVRAVCERGRNALAVETHVTSEGQVTTLIACISKRFGQLDILVNNASWNSVMDTNLSAMFLCAREQRELTSSSENAMCT